MGIFAVVVLILYFLNINSIEGMAQGHSKNAATLKKTSGTSPNTAIAY